MSREERIGLIEWDRAELPLSIQADLLTLNRSGLYYRAAPPSGEEISLKHRIDEIYTEHPYYGSRRITACLRMEDFEVSRKTVGKHMREMGIEAIYPGPNLSRRDLSHRIFPYLLKDLSIDRTNQVWGIDITYIRLQRSWMYLVAIIDWYSRYIVAWELDQTLEIDFVLEAVNTALKKANPEILNSDQGSHFTSLRYIELLRESNVAISMDGKGRAKDNILIERFWRSIKYEEVYLKEYESPREARNGIKEYMNFYNSERPHQSLGYITPARLYYN